MGTKVNSNYEDLLTFTRASKGHALRPVSYGDNELPSASFEVIGTGTWDDTEFIDTVGSQVRPGVTSQTSLTNGTTYALFINITDITGATQVRIDGLDGTDRLIGEGDHRISFTSNGGTPRIRLEDTSTSVNDGFTVQSAITAKEVLFDQPDGTLTLFEHPENVPRVEYDADGNRLGLLVEEARTNLVTYSEDFSNSSWNSNKQGISVSTNVAVAPDGTLTADKLNETATTDTHRVGFNISSVGDAVFSFFAKAGERTLVRTWAFVGGNTAGAEFNLSNGTIVRERTNGAATIKNVGNGWYRCSCTVDAASANSVVVGPVTEAVDGNASYAGEAGKGIYIWGAQLEQASFPTSYIKTTGSTATRSADVASIPVADFGYNQSAFTLLMEASHLYDTFPTFNRFWELTGGGDLIRLAGDSGSLSYMNLTVGGVQQISFSTGAANAADANTFMKYAVGLKTDDFDIARDGSLDTGDTSITMPDAIDTLGIGVSTNGSVPLSGHIKSIKYYPRRLTNAQLQALTEPRSDATLSLTFDGLESSFTENYIHG